MFRALLLLTLFAGPFWEARPPAEWSDTELENILTDSPWAEMVAAGGNANVPPVQVYLATAAPIALAETEYDLRQKRRRPANAKPVEDPFAEEYQAWLEDNRASQIIAAVRVGRNPAFSDQREVHRMEEESIMRVGRKKFKMTGHFPPSPSDPYLRMAFPRQVTVNDKAVSFELYLPGVPIPFRAVEFTVKDMLFHGRLEM
ncbi:MAG: hypothetical protein ABSB35_09335 [Bryobacteraceae bacterium]|jgi:hypothetical protein